MTEFERILVVDDEEICRLIVQWKFQQMGVTQIEEACDGEEALKLIVEEPPFDLILLDINMPVMDGFEFLEELQSFCETTGTATPPVALLTSSFSASDKAKSALYPSVKAYLTKPFSSEHIDSLLQLVKVKEL